MKQLFNKISQIIRFPSTNQIKILLGILLSVLFIHPAYSYDFAHLNIKITNPTEAKTLFLCVSNIGCVNLQSGIRGKQFPLNPGSVNYVFLANGANLQMFRQALPDSCHVMLKNNQTLTVTGVVNVTEQNQARINKLHCSIG